MSKIQRFLDRARPRVYTYLQLQQAILEHRRDWHLGTVSASTIMELLLAETQLKVVELTSESYSSEQRLVWGTPSAYELAHSLRPGAYFAYGTAAYLRGLLEEAPTTFHVNKEQTPKEQRGGLTQEALDRAFASRPRKSKLVFSDGLHRFVVIAGKFTNGLEVGHLRGPAGERLQATKVERTLIDISVRPIYCGGVQRVLEAYRAARGVLSPNRLMTTLKRLGHLYPYHQVIGFYLERAGYGSEVLGAARRPGLHFDFYLAHGMGDRAYSKEWRLYYPRGL
jgi:hypothetical protein